MARRYAEGTTVSTEKSRAEIEQILTRYGADQFGYVQDNTRGLAVEAGISEFEEEFLAHIILPGGGTVSQLMRPQIEKAYLTGDIPAGISGLLPAPENTHEDIHKDIHNA